MVKKVQSKFKKFIPQSSAAELILLQQDDSRFLDTIEYLKPMVSAAIVSHGKPAALEKKILKDIPLAAKRYLKEKERTYRFSTYFTWYLSKHLNSSQAGGGHGRRSEIRQERRSERHG